MYWSRQNNHGGAEIPKRERGFIAVAGVVLIVVIGLMIATLGRMTATDNWTGTLFLQSEDAIFAARSGIDFAGFNLSGGVACASLPATAQTVGGGSFTVTGTLNNGATTLSTGIGATDTVIPVASVATLGSHGLVSIGNEDIQYGSTGTTSAACSGLGSACLLGVTRGHNGSTAASALSGAAVSQLQCLVRSTGTALGSASATRIVEGTFEIRNPAVSLPQAMMVYSKGSTQMFSRRWDPQTGGWSSEVAGSTATGGAGRNFHHLAIALSRTRDEAVVVGETRDATDTGQLYAMRWTGSTGTPANSWVDMTTLSPVAGSITSINSVGATMTSPAGTPKQVFARGIDVAYETSGDRAIVAYDNGGSATPQYRIFNGTAPWTAAASTNVGTGAGLQNIPLWIELAANPISTSNEIALITLQAHETIAAREAVQAAVWNGTAWTAINSANRMGVPSNNMHRKAVAVAYESMSGRAMYAWSSSTAAGATEYTLCNVATCSAGIGFSTSVTIASSTGIGEWLRLASQPRSNNIMLALQSANRNLDTLLWNGSAWGAAHPQHDATTLSRTEKNFELVFENHPSASGSAWLAWGDTAALFRRRFEGGTSWSSIQGVTVASGAPAVSYVDMRVNPLTGRIIDGLYTTSSSAVAGIWTSTRQGAIRDAANRFTPLGWYAPPMVAPTTNGLVNGTATVNVASPGGQGSRVALAVRQAGASLIEVQEIFQ